MIDLNKVPEGVKKDLAFQMVVAMRDTINIAKKKGQKSTYENSIRLFNDFSPELYTNIVNSLPQRNLSPDAQLIIAKAEFLSHSDNKIVTPLELVQNEIDDLEKLLGSPTSKNIKEEKRILLKRRRGVLEGVKKSFQPRVLSENRILNRDSSRANREDFGAKLINETDFYVDYVLTNNKYLRIRLLHPDKPEHITGADLIYEQHDENRGEIRFIFLQYKIWENGILYLSKVNNLEKQIEKLEACLCKGKFCESPIFHISEKDFRFPYCSAFLRPTDKLQEQNEKLVSSGIHIPICTINQLKDHIGNKLEKNKLQFQTLTHEIFEHLFNRGFIGSRWMKEEEVEEFYKKNKILENDESVVFYAREINEVQESDTLK